MYSVAGILLGQFTSHKSVYLSAIQYDTLEMNFKATAFSGQLSGLRLLGRKYCLANFVAWQHFAGDQPNPVCTAWYLAQKPMFAEQKYSLVSKFVLSKFIGFLSGREGHGILHVVSLVCPQGVNFIKLASTDLPSKYNSPAKMSCSVYWVWLVPCNFFVKRQNLPSSVFCH